MKFHRFGYLHQFHGPHTPLFVSKVDESFNHFSLKSYASARVDIWLLTLKSYSPTEMFTSAAPLHLVGQKYGRQTTGVL